MHVNLNLRQESIIDAIFAEEDAAITGSLVFVEFVLGNLPRKEGYLESEKQAGKEKKRWLL
jgi:hypothetical protein